eukprot:38791-Hanusia_phi.AAC.1
MTRTVAATREGFSSLRPQPRLGAAQPGRNREPPTHCGNIMVTSRLAKHCEACLGGPLSETQAEESEAHPMNKETQRFKRFQCRASVTE